MATAPNPAPAGSDAPAPVAFLLEHGLLRAEQVAELLHAATLSGTTLEALALERGLVDEAALAAAARAYAALQTEARRPSLLVTAASSGPAVEPDAAPHVVEFAVTALLASGTTLELEAHASHDAALSRASALAASLGGAEPDEWQRLGDALVRPAAVLAFDVRPRAPRR